MWIASLEYGQSGVGLEHLTEQGLKHSIFSPCSNSLHMWMAGAPSLELSFFDCKKGICIIAVFPKCGKWITGGT